MVYEAERLIDRRFGRSHVRRRLIVILGAGTVLLGIAIALLVVILIRKI